ncbi:MAG: hypothetical protein KKB66_16045 [Alphaproteobacteria bacterium]|nr:hypothetical protein [Alphaproteobacteria bacterium]MBU0804313.1 hypothetical protein [Alphaproteobacteria bacterium]MBU0871144.1 hypothetical protein [Alphaproteobacteria bacterium]MBU1400899.1 hypothetical protein [Alphaproteobacteria bacterium]MBU1592684.1 hypothetical protein [Alphaproteobacteria bacterium]
MEQSSIGGEYSGRRGPEIPTLPQRRDSGSETRFHIGVSGASIGEQAHGFAVLVDDGQENVLAAITFKSTTAKTTHMRGALGAALTALEFIDTNCQKDDHVSVYSSDEYVSKWLKPNIKKWLRDPKRLNKDILAKIAPLLERRPEVAFFAGADSPSTSLKTHASELAKQAKGGIADHFNDDDELTEEQVNEMLRERALSRDPWA